MKKWNDLSNKVKLGLVSGAAIIVVAGGVEYQRYMLKMCTKIRKRI